MGRPCTCQACRVCGEGKCDCTCKNGPHLSIINVYEIRSRLEDMTPKQRKDFVDTLLKDLNMPS